MNTLVIHPEDPTTDFLSDIYCHQSWRVLSNPVELINLGRMIEQHDRIIMLGHGTPKGLLGFGTYVVDMYHSEYLRKKICICIWCHAIDFAVKHDLKGFATGMFISEPREATYYNVRASQEEIELSNRLFAQKMGKVIDDPMRITDLYVSDSNPIVKYNSQRMFNIESVGERI